MSRLDVGFVHIRPQATGKQPEVVLWIEDNRQPLFWSHVPQTFCDMSCYPSVSHYMDWIFCTFGCVLCVCQGTQKVLGKHIKCLAVLLLAGVRRRVLRANFAVLGVVSLPCLWSLHISSLRALGLGDIRVYKVSLYLISKLVSAGSQGHESWCRMHFKQIHRAFTNTLLQNLTQKTLEKVLYFIHSKTHIVFIFHCLRSWSVL